MATKQKSFPIRKSKLTIEGLFNKPLSATIRIAVKDLKTNVKNGAEVNMRTWGKRNGECTGCFAGHCLLPYTHNVDYFKNHNRYARSIAYALNDVRQGNLGQAVESLYDNITEGDITEINEIESKAYVQDWGTFQYQIAPKTFCKNMLRIAHALERIWF
jgi:hypothetical protein